jgi:hypothetical protein
MKIRLCRPFYCDCRNLAAANMATLEPYRTGEYTYEMDGHTIIDEPRMGSHIGKLRRTLVNDQKSFAKYQKMDFDGYLWWDSDLGATAEDIRHVLAMVAKYGYNIFCLPYTNHSGTRYLASLEKARGVEDGHFPLDTRGLQMVHLAALGFSYIAREVFESLEYPWWREAVIPYCDGQEQLNEDYGMCVQARHGPGLWQYQIWADFDRPVRHGKRNHDSFMWTNKNKGSTMEQKQTSIDEVALNMIAGIQNLVNIIKQLAAENGKLKEEAKKPPE